MKRWILPLLLAVLLAFGGSASAEDAAEWDAMGYWYVANSGGHAYFLYTDGDIARISNNLQYTFDGETLALTLDGQEILMEYSEGMLSASEITFIAASVDEGGVAGLWHVEGQDSYEMYLYDDGTGYLENIDGTYQVSDNTVTFEDSSGETVFYEYLGTLVNEDNEVILSRMEYDGQMAGVWRAQEEAEEPILVFEPKGAVALHSLDSYPTSAVYAVSGDYLVVTEYAEGPRGYEIISYNELYSLDDGVLYAREIEPSEADSLLGTWHPAEDPALGDLEFYGNGGFMLYERESSEFVHGTYAVEDGWVTLTLEDGEEAAMQLLDAKTLYLPGSEQTFVRSDVLP